MAFDVRGLPQVSPWDEHNQRWVSQVRPSDWPVPVPQGRYNLVVIGAGPAGLIAAAGGAGLGAKVALVERDLMGGDCLNVGCVPSKGLLRAARACADIRDASRFGIDLPVGGNVDFARVMERVRRLRAGLSPADAAARFRELGVDVFFGEARFVSPETVAVGDVTLRFRNAVIATGARAALPEIPGLNEAGCLTNETVFTLTTLPRRLAVIGAGPIGCELAQAFARLGARVTLIADSSHILPRDDADAAAIVQQSLLRDGIELCLGAQVIGVERRTGAKVVRVRLPEVLRELEVDEVLVGVGRVPNVDGLGLEPGGVQYDRQQGVRVDDYLRTSNPRVYAAGDVCSKFRFTHAADAMARIVLQNALFFGWSKASALTIPHCTYTDPEVAQVGLTEAEARARGIAVQTLVQPFSHLDRAVLDDESEGLAKVHVRGGSDEIVGATIVARHAGEMISQITLAMVGKLGLRTLAKTIHPYPTQAECLKKLADQYNRTRLTPRVKRWFSRWLAWTR